MPTKITPSFKASPNVGGLFHYLCAPSFMRRVQSDRRPTGFKLRCWAVIEDDRTSEGDQIVAAAEQKREKGPDVQEEKQHKFKKICPHG